MSFLGILLPLLSAFFGAIATSISKVVVDEAGAKQLTILTFGFVSLVMAPLSPLFFHIGNVTLFLLVMGVITLTDSIANLLFFVSLESDDVSKVTALASLSPLFTAIITPFILPSHFGVGVFLATAVIVLSIYVIETGEIGSLKHNLRRRETLYVVASALLLGASALPMRFMLNEWSVTNAPTLYFVRAALIALVLFLVLRPSFAHITKRTYGLIAGKSVLVSIQWVVMLYTLGMFNVITTKALSQTVPLFVFFIAYKELGESFNIHRLVGICLIILSIVGIHLLGLTA